MRKIAKDDYYAITTVLPPKVQIDRTAMTVPVVFVATVDYEYIS